MKKLKISKKSFETVFTFNLEPQKAVEIIIPTPPDTPPPVPEPEPIYPPFPPLIPFPPTTGSPFSPSLPAPFDPIPPVEGPYYQPKLWRKLCMYYSRGYAWRGETYNHSITYNQDGKTRFEAFKESHNSHAPTSGLVTITAMYPDDFGETITELGYYPVNEYALPSAVKKSHPIVLWDAYWTKEGINYGGFTGEEVNDFFKDTGAAMWAPYIMRYNTWSLYWEGDSFWG